MVHTTVKQTRWSARFVKNVLFDGCQSTEDGAAIYIDYDNVEFLPEDATYTDNFIVNNVRRKKSALQRPIEGPFYSVRFCF